MTPATSSITCLAVRWGCGTSPSSNLPGPIVSTRPTARFTVNTPVVNCVTRKARLGTVARYSAGPTVLGLSEFATPTNMTAAPASRSIAPPRLAASQPKMSARHAQPEALANRWQRKRPDPSAT